MMPSGKNFIVFFSFSLLFFLLANSNSASAFHESWRDRGYGENQAWGGNGGWWGGGNRDLLESYGNDLGTYPKYPVPHRRCCYIHPCHCSRPCYGYSHNPSYGDGWYYYPHYQYYNDDSIPGGALYVDFNFR